MEPLLYAFNTMLISKVLLQSLENRTKSLLSNFFWIHTFCLPLMFSSFCQNSTATLIVFLYFYYLCCPCCIMRIFFHILILCNVAKPFSDSGIFLCTMYISYNRILPTNITARNVIGVKAKPESSA